MDSRRRNYGDADEIEEEQREKQARKKINRNFFKFCKEVEEFVKKNDPDGEERVKFDFPSRELGFYGVPFKVWTVERRIVLFSNVSFFSPTFCCSQLRKIASCIWSKDLPSSFLHWV